MVFGTPEQLTASSAGEWERYHFFDRMRLWLEATDQKRLDFSNVIVLSEYFWKELKNHPIPVDLTVVKALSDSPGNLDFYMWLTWRCWKAKGMEFIPLFGPNGLVNQMGMGTYTRPRRLVQRVKQWLEICKRFWPECPANWSNKGDYLIVSKGDAILARRDIGRASSVQSSFLEGMGSATSTAVR